VSKNHFIQLKKPPYIHKPTKYGAKPDLGPKWGQRFLVNSSCIFPHIHEKNTCKPQESIRSHPGPGRVQFCGHLKGGNSKLGAPSLGGILLSKWLRVRVNSMFGLPEMNEQG